MNIRNFLLVVLAAMNTACFSFVDSTEHCIETRYGTVVNPKVTSGPTSTITTKLECFPVTQQQFPGGNVTGEDAKSETVEFLTRDSVMLAVDIAFNWKYTSPNQAFIARRSHDAVLSELTNAMRSGARDAGATIGLPDLMGTNRAGLDEKFRTAINNQLTNYATVEKVYIRSVKIPDNIRALWSQNSVIAAEQQKARAQFLTDSLNARRTVINAQAAAQKTELETRALATSPEVLRLRMAEAMSRGMASVCAKASTCIIGGNVADDWLSRMK